MRKSGLGQREVAKFVFDMSCEMRTLAQDAQTPGLVFLLGMVVHEAKNIAERDPAHSRTSAANIQRLYMKDALDD